MTRRLFFNPRLPAVDHSVFRGGFTMVEMLVSVAVLALLAVLMAQLVGATSGALTLTRKRVDADAQARLIFDRIGVDIANIVQRPDVDYSSFKQPAGTLPSQFGGGTVAANTMMGTSGGGNDQMAFYAKGIGYFSNAATPPPTNLRASQSLVAYYMDTDPYFYGGGRSVLQRMGKGVGWEADSGGAFLSLAYLPTMITSTGQWPNLFATYSSGNKDQDWKTVGDQVFRFEYNYFLKPNYTGSLPISSTTSGASKLSNVPYWNATNGLLVTNPHTAINGFQDVAAIVVALGVLDSNSSIIVSSSNTTLVKLLPDAAEGADIKASWQAVILSPTFPTTAGIPPQAASSVRTYERYFYLSGH